MGARGGLRLPLPTVNYNASIKRDPGILWNIQYYKKLLDDNSGFSDYLNIMEEVGV